MCGIVGIFSYQKNIEDQKPFISWALQTMHRRGPDSNGIWSNSNNYIAGFVRLAIRDLSANGNQPMASSCGRYILSFNGEIYNAAGFRQRLQQAGVHFRSSTDTEVLLYGLIHWGEAYVLKHYDGLFAFAFYDNLKNELLLARDRSGIKPLYLGYGHQGLVYSSQYDHVINHAYQKNNALNTGAIGAYLALGFVPGNTGAVNGTLMMPHGHYVRVTTHGFTQHRYYSYEPSVQPHDREPLENMLADNVRSQLVSDVPVGTFMSGGVDSPLVTYFAGKYTGISSFTLGVDDAAMDESSAAAAYAATFKSNHFCRHITSTDLLQTIDDNTKSFSEPFAAFTAIPTLSLSRFTRQHVAVALSGDGGDELFWGYKRNLRMLHEGLEFEHGKLFRTLKFLGQKLSGSRRTIRRRHLDVNDFTAYYFRSLLVTGAEKWLPEIYNETVAMPYFLEQLYQQPGIFDVNPDNVMNIVRKLEFDLHLQRILLKVDRASMYHSLEVRVPLLSNEVIDYSTGLTYRDCIQHKHGKYNLKALLIEKTSQQMVLQPKKGFVIPLAKWMRGPLKQDLEDKLMNMPTELRVLFNNKQVRRMLHEHQGGKADWSWMLWSLYSLINWHTCHRHAR